MDLLRSFMSIILDYLVAACCKSFLYVRLIIWFENLCYRFGKLLRSWTLTCCSILVQKMAQIFVPGLYRWVEKSSSLTWLDTAWIGVKKVWWKLKWFCLYQHSINIFQILFLWIEKILSQKDYLLKLAYLWSFWYPPL